MAFIFNLTLFLWISSQLIIAAEPPSLSFSMERFQSVHLDHLIHHLHHLHPCLRSSIHFKNQNPRDHHRLLHIGTHPEALAGLWSWTTINRFWYLGINSRYNADLELVGMKWLIKQSAEERFEDLEEFLSSSVSLSFLYLSSHSEHMIYCSYQGWIRSP